MARMTFLIGSIPERHRCLSVFREKWIFSGHFSLIMWGKTARDVILSLIVPYLLSSLKNFLFFLEERKLKNNKGRHPPSEFWGWRGLWGVVKDRARLKTIAIDFWIHFILFFQPSSTFTPLFFPFLKRKILPIGHFSSLFFYPPGPKRGNSKFGSDFFLPGLGGRSPGRFRRPLPRAGGSRFRGPVLGGEPGRGLHGGPGRGAPEQLQPRIASYPVPLVRPRNWNRRVEKWGRLIKMKRKSVIIKK